MTLTNKEVKVFQRKIYSQKYRPMAWRETDDPYLILVSEFMLQQTQVQRVKKYFPVFVQSFPTIFTLAQSSLQQVLNVWSGLGYNNRALRLKKTAEKVCESYDGFVPSSLYELVKLPGIGPATAGAIISFAFNLPSVFIETNIRRVYIDHFFQNKIGVSDADLFPLIEKTLDKNNPRKWYYALMDTGSAIKNNKSPNPNRRSAQYTNQSPFQGSMRQLRGQIIKILIDKGPIEKSVLQSSISTMSDKSIKKDKFDNAISLLIAEGFLTQKKFLISFKDC